MPEQNNYDMHFRPINYWGPQELHTHFGSRVKGELRKKAGLDLLEQGENDQEVLSESLTDEHRKLAGAFHPALMGGEHLPDLKRNEVEIARIIAQSTTLDVISIRARKGPSRIFYRIVDEYDEEYQEYNLTKKSSIKPLTFAELIHLIDNAIDNGLVGNGRTWFFEDGLSAEEVYDFETASSSYYHELESWSDEANEEWLKDKQMNKI